MSLILIGLLSAMVSTACTAPVHEERETPHFAPFTSVQIESSIYGEVREVFVRLPPTYNEKFWRGFHVVYLLDGGLGQDFYSALGVLNAEERGFVVEPVILVGIPSIDRLSEYTPDTDNEGYDRLFPNRGGAERHLQYINEEIVPQIEARFNAKGKTLAGQSLGGLLVLQACGDPKVHFDAHIAISPSLWWNRGRSVAHIDACLPHHGRLHLAIGNEQGLIRDETLRTVERFNRRALSPVTFSDFLYSEDHNSVYLTALQDAVRTLFLRPRRVNAYQVAFEGLPDHDPPPPSELAEASLRVPCNSITSIETSFSEIAKNPEVWNGVCVLAKPGRPAGHRSIE